MSVLHVSTCQFQRGIGVSLNETSMEFYRLYRQLLLCASFSVYDSQVLDVCEVKTLREGWIITDISEHRSVDIRWLSFHNIIATVMAQSLNGRKVLSV